MNRHVRKFLRDLADELDGCPRVNQIAPEQVPVIVMTDQLAQELAKRARELANSPPPTVVSALAMPTPLPPMMANREIPKAA
jgi:hypothetical protein